MSMIYSFTFFIEGLFYSARILTKTSFSHRSARVLFPVLFRYILFCSILFSFSFMHHPSCCVYHNVIHGDSREGRQRS